MDASRVHDDGCGADADARLPGASRAPRARLGERPAQHPGGGGDRPRAAARWRRSASSRRFRARFAPLRCAHAAERARSDASRALRLTGELRRAKVPVLRERCDRPRRGRRGRRARRRWRGSTERAARCPGASARSRSTRSRRLRLPAVERARPDARPATRVRRSGSASSSPSSTSAGRSSLDGVWVVGDGGGTGGARLAGRSGSSPASMSRGASAATSRPRSRRGARGEARAPRGAAGSSAGSARLFAAPRLVDQLAAPETLVCRCEEVPLRSVEASLEDGASAIGAVKRVTRRRDGALPGPLLRERPRGSLGAAVGRAAHRGRTGSLPAPPFKPIPVGVAVEALGAIRGAGTARTG